MADTYSRITEMIKKHDDKIFYSQIFNILTDNDTVKNYSSNNNGIFFDFNSISPQTVQKVSEFIDGYKRKCEEKEKYEKTRGEIIDKNTYSMTVTALTEEIKKSSLHTDIYEEEDVEMEVDYYEEETTDFKELFGEDSDEEY